MISRLFSTLLCAASISTTSAGLQNQGYDLFKTVLGHDRVGVHYSSEEHFRAAVQDQMTSIKKSQVDAHYVGCTEYASARIGKQAIVSAVGEDSVHTLYMSHSNDLACFLVYASPSDIKTLASSRDARFSTMWTPIPSNLKIDHAAMHMLGLTSGKSFTDINRINPVVLGKAMDLSRSELAISFGLAASGHKSVDTVGVKNIVQSMSERVKAHPATHLRKSMGVLAADYHVELKTHAETLESSDAEGMCSFHNLQFKDKSSKIHIEGIHHIQSSAHPEACYASLMAMFVSEPNVINVAIHEAPRLYNDFCRSIGQSGVASSDNSTNLYNQAGLTGQDVVVGIADTGLDEYHCFFENSDGSRVARSSYTNPTHDDSKRKVIQYVSYVDGSDYTHGHGTHVSGTVAGESLSGTNSEHNGVAYDAKIAFFDIGNSQGSLSIPDYPYLYNAAKEAGGHLHSNSWGSGMNQYDSDMVDTDIYMVDNQDFLVLFAAGNDGAEGYYSVGSPAIAKNVLTVGATESHQMTNINYMAYFSGIGPSFDNRIKPEICAPGYFVYSADANSECGIYTMAGTSMATPNVAGYAALIRQYFEDSDFWEEDCDDSYDDRCDAFSPKGATVKAAIIHSGQQMSKYYTEGAPTTEPNTNLVPPPDFFQGFGRLFLQNVLPLSGVTGDMDLFVDENSLDEYEQMAYTVRFTDAPTTPLKATIVWMDPGNTYLSNKMLLHDLDLIVIAPDGSIKYSNNIESGRDEYNNVEQIYIEFPVIGDYEVLVQSKSLPESLVQPFSIIITSEGLVVDVSGPTTLTDADFNICDAGEVALTLTLMDHEGDGWLGNYVQINDGSNTVVYTGNMDGSDNSDMWRQEYVCLPVNQQYTASVKYDGGDSSGMFFDAYQCGVFLNGDMASSAVMNIDADGNCNLCGVNSTLLSISLSGSFYGVGVYGWPTGSFYEITRSGDNDYLQASTLPVGMLIDRTVCLEAGSEFTLTLNNFPISDDYFDDAGMNGYFGVEEYSMTVTGCGSTIDTDSWDRIDSNDIIFTTDASGGCTYTTQEATRENGGGGGDDDNSLDAGIIAAIVIAVIAVIVIASVVYFCNKKNPGFDHEKASMISTSNL